MGRLAIAVLVLASCKGDERGTTPVSNVAAPAPSSAIPAGWVTFEPSDERLRCEDYSRDALRIAVDRGAVRLTVVTRPERYLETPLPFALPKQQLPWGFRHVRAFAGGFLVGIEGGEFGGALYWFARDGARWKKLADQNVRDLVPLGPDAALALEGLRHMGLDEGAVRWIEHRGGAFDATGVTKLPGAPEAFVAVAGGLYLLTSSSLVRIGPDHRVVSVQPVRKPGLFAESMTIDAGGALWIGLGRLVLRLVPEGGRFSETWLVREGCQRAELIDEVCVCRGN